MINWKTCCIIICNKTTMLSHRFKLKIPNKSICQSTTEIDLHTNIQTNQLQIEPQTDKMENFTVWFKAK